MAYVDYGYYMDTYRGTAIPPEEADGAFLTASDTVDALTYCRISERGFDSLTAFQRSTIQRVVCRLADWQTDNADMLDSAYTNYAINGVSASWGAGAGVRRINGQTVPASVYAELVKTGLCFAGVRG